MRRKKKRKSWFRERLWGTIEALTWCVRYALTGAVLLGVFVGAFLGIRKTLFADDIFSLSALNVRTDGILTAAEISRIAGVHLGENILLLGLDAITHKLESDQRIREAIVTRVLPSQILIRVEERRAFLRIRDPRKGTLWAMDREGFFLAPAKSDDAIPLFEDLRLGHEGHFHARGYRDQRVLARLSALMDLLLKEPLVLNRPVRELKMESPDKITAVLEGILELRLGEDFEKNLRKLEALRPVLARELDSLEYIDLRFRDVVVKKREIKRR